MDMAGGAKGMFYRWFQSKEEVMHALGSQMFFENNPFEAVKGRNDLNGLEKIRLLLAQNQSDTERNQINMQAIPILKDPRILAAAVGENRRVLTPLWLELLDEGKKDGSIKTEYTKELSELLPLINFWLMPSVFPATEEELRHKYRFVTEVLAHMGLPLYDDDTAAFTEKFITDITDSLY
jgi:AcrR family transcriptional regulator